MQRPRGVFDFPWARVLYSLRSKLKERSFKDSAAASPRGGSAVKGKHNMPPAVNNKGPPQGGTLVRPNSAESFAPPLHIHTICRQYGGLEHGLSYHFRRFALR